MRHEEEAERNLRVWREKALLRDVYAQAFARIDREIDRSLPGKIVEIGSGVGNLREHRGGVLCSDRFLQPWMDVVADGYALPYRAGSISHFILVDVFHHLALPLRFFTEARRALVKGGRIIIYEPYVSLSSMIPYGLLHSEGIHWRADVDRSDADPSEYYTAQGNATRFFFNRNDWLDGWDIVRKERYAAFAYLLSGGFSSPALYPRKLLPVLNRIDAALSRFPRLFGARCLVVLTPRS